MPRTKNFLPKKEKKGKHAQQAPETADEYLAAGVDFEEAGEKWRGGDAAKSARFFIRAIECYDEALKKFPGSSDLAYNKARVQYELTQHPKLLAQLPGSLLNLLRSALESSRYALKLNEDNADVLFNTAQILTSLSEAISDTPSAAVDPIPFLEEALTLFERCFALQEQQYTESQAQSAAMAAELARQDSSQPPESSVAEALDPQDSMLEDRWATILEPVTSATLMDTITATIQTLTLLLNLLPYPTSPLLPWIQDSSSTLISTKLPFYQSQDPPSSTDGSALTLATFNTALATAIFRSQTPTLQTLHAYTAAINEIATALPISTPESLVAKAETLLTYHDTLRTLPDIDSDSTLPLRWQTLFTALEALSEAAKLPGAENLSRVHLTRGDAEMLRWQLGQEGNEFEAAKKSAKTLLGNAEKFYRGAGKMAVIEGESKVQVEAGVKEKVVKLLDGREADGFVRDEVVMGVLEETIEEGVFTVGQLTALGVV